MDDGKPDTLTDDALDRELRAALRIDPSPEYLARVRVRVVAGEPVGRSWWWTGMWIGGAAAASMVVVAALVWSPAAQAPAIPRSVSVRGMPMGAAPARAAIDEVPVMVPVVAPRSVSRTPAPAQAIRAVPQVLFSNDERQALTWLVQVASGRRVESVPSRQPVEPMDVPEVAIVPLAIGPLPQLASLTSGAVE